MSRLTGPPDWRVFFFGIALCFAAFALMAMALGWKAASSDPSVLREGSSTNRAQGWRALVAIQVALCTALLFGAAAVNATLKNLRNLDPGFARESVISFSVDRDLVCPAEA